MTTDWTGLILQGIALIATIGGPLGTLLLRLSTKVAVLTTEVKALKDRLDGNGDSVPGRCSVHDQRLKTMESQVQQLAEGE